MGELRMRFRPEFLNRVDDIVLFAPLTLEQIERIVEMQVDGLRRRLLDRRIDLALTPGARDHIAREAYDPVYGARPLRRFIQHEVETRVGRALLSGEITPGSRIVIDVVGDELAVRWSTPDAEADAATAREPDPAGAGVGG